ncbi:hypothetical protein [Bradyrhizobium cenepequi]
MDASRNAQIRFKAVRLLQLRSGIRDTSGSHIGRRRHVVASRNSSTKKIDFRLTAVVELVNLRRHE